MMNQEISELCAHYNIEPRISDDVILFISPDMPPMSVQTKIVESMGIPSGHFKFLIGPRMGTLDALKSSIGKITSVMNADLLMTDHGLELKMTVSEEGVTAYELDEASQIIRKDPFIHTYSITANGEEICSYNRKLVELMEKQTRPNRIKGFTADDLLNLKIALAQSMDVEEFINAI